jgi:hypothetical protein
VQIVEVDVVHPQPLQAALDGAADVGGRAVDLQGGALGVVADAEFGGDEGLVAPVGQRLADLDLVGVRAVHLGRVEEGDAQFERAVDHRRRLILIRALAVEGGHAHTAQADGRNFRTRTAQRARLHERSPCNVGGRRRIRRLTG